MGTKGLLKLEKYVFYSIYKICDYGNRSSKMFFKKPLTAAIISKLSFW